MTPPPERLQRSEERYRTLVENLNDVIFCTDLDGNLTYVSAPIERVWGLLKDQVAANRLHGSIDLLVAEAERFFATHRFHAPHPLATPVRSST